MPHVPAVKGTILTSSTILVMILNRSPLMEWVILYLKPSLLSCSLVQPPFQPFQFSRLAGNIGKQASIVGLSPCALIIRLKRHPLTDVYCVA